MRAHPPRAVGSTVPMYVHTTIIQPKRAAAITPWYRLRLPSCSRGFESQAHHLSFFNLYYWNCNQRRTKINKKGRDWPIFFKKTIAVTSVALLQQRVRTNQFCFQSRRPATGAAAIGDKLFSDKHQKQTLSRQREALWLVELEFFQSFEGSSR